MAGLEVLYCTVQSQINEPSDALVCCLHWNVIANKFKCVGVGEKASQVGKKSELLPAGWSSDSTVYTLLYQPADGTDTHLLKVIRMEESLLVHFMRLKDERASSMNIRIHDYVTDDLSSFDSAFKNTSGLQKKFKKEIIDDLKPEDKGQSSSRSQLQTQSQERRSRLEEDDDPLRVGPRRGGRYPRPEWGAPDDPFAVGRGDLDPLAGGMGGGMLMDPFRRGPVPGRPGPGAGLPGRLPPGAVPPGARFDPFGIPDPDGPMPGRGNRAGPGADHLPPPGFDDMFM